MNCFAAFFAIAFELGYIAFSLYLFSSPAAVLLASQQRSRYGAMYQDVKGSDQSSLSIAVFHNIRILFLIIFMVFGADCPQFQASIYFVSATIGAGWDLALRPYEGILLQAQMLFLGLVKVAASVGYVILTVPTVTTSIAEMVGTYEVATLLAAIGVGMGLALVQQAMDVCAQVRAICRKLRNREKIYMPTGSDVQPSLNQEDNTSVGICKATRPHF